MPVYEVKARAKNHWWNFWDEIRSKVIAPDNETAVESSRHFWRGQGVNHFQFLSVTKIEEK